MTGLSGDEMAAVAGGLADAESSMALADLMHAFDSEQLYTEAAFPASAGGRVPAQEQDARFCAP